MARCTCDNYEDEDFICHVWKIEDVQHLDSTLTDDEARDVLSKVHESKDASVGINWDVLQVHIDYLNYYKDVE